MLTKLIKSNFKNDFSHMITFFLIMVIAVFMLYTGLAILIGYSDLHKQKKEEYNFADLEVKSVTRDEDNMLLEDIISNADYIQSYEKKYPINKEISVSKSGFDEDSLNMFDTSSVYFDILPYGEFGDIEAPHFVELSDEEYDNPIYISYYYNSSLFKAKLGDSIDMKVGNRYYTFQVAGLFESLMSSEDGVLYVSHSQYNEWLNEQYNNLVKNSKGENSDSGKQVFKRIIYDIKLSDGINPTEASGLLTKAFSEHELSAYAMSVDNTINNFTYMQNMIAALIAAFALVITVIAMIIIYFRITNSIEQNIVNIGALKALGYTSRQIRLAMVLEFTLATAAALISGVAASNLVLPVFEEKMRGFSAVCWDHKFDPVSFAITFLLIIGTVMVVSFISTKMITKLDPVIALRFGINTHSFKKNYAPIEKTAGSLTWIMALKSVLGNTKQNVILFVVMLSIGVVTTFSVFLSYNCVYDCSHLYRMLNLLSDDVVVVFKDDKNRMEEIKKLPEVDSVFYTDTVEMTCEGYSVYVIGTEDWDDIGEVNIYEGRRPKYDNEVTIGGNLANTLGVSIGDEVKLSYGRKDFSYLITGLDQNAVNYGMDLCMTAEGMEHLNYKLNMWHVDIAVKGHTLDNAKKVLDDIQDMYGDEVASYGNIIETLNNGDNEIITIASIMVFIMALISILVIILSLNLLVKTTIIKKYREIGIKKALGFSSDQLRTELALSMLPQIFLGAVTGSVIGCLVSNRILASLLVTMGIMRSNMEIFPWMGMISVLFGVLVSFVIIWFLSGKIKKISAYSLITE